MSKITIEYYDERRNFIGGDQQHMPPGTAYVAVKMPVPVEGQSPVSGYALTPEEVAEIAERSFRPLWQEKHATAPGEGQPVFGGNSRELPGGVPAGEIDYPLLSTCSCGRPITKVLIGEDWQYCG